MFDPWQGQEIFPLTSVSRPALGPTQPPVQWVPGVLSPGAKHSQGMTLTTHPHLVLRSWLSRSYKSSPPPPPPAPPQVCCGTALLFYCSSIWQKRLEEGNTEKPQLGSVPAKTQTSLIWSRGINPYTVMSASSLLSTVMCLGFSQGLLSIVSMICSCFWRRALLIIHYY
jgi:hypothetical protein